VKVERCFLRGWVLGWALSWTCFSSLGKAAEPFEASHQVAYDLVLPPGMPPSSLESMTLGPRGHIWLACRVSGQAGQEDTGQLVVYEPNGLLFDVVKIPFVPLAMNFSTRSWLYLATQEKIIRLSVHGQVEAEIAVERLYGSPEAAAKVSRGRPAIAANEEAVFVAYPDSGGNAYSVWRLSPDLSIEAKIVERAESCLPQFEIQADGEHLLVVEATRGQVGIYDPQGRRIGGFGEKGEDGLAGFSGGCNPIALWPLSTEHVLTGEIGNGQLKRYTHRGMLLGLVAKLPVPSDSQRLCLAWDAERNWYYALLASQAKVAVLLPSEDIEIEPSTSAIAPGSGK
jgi:hypothetical protein